MNPDSRRPHDAASSSWWTWPGRLALDAPLVALGWQGAVAASLHVPVSWRDAALIAIPVWLAYALDRWLDARHLAPAGRDADRGSHGPATRRHAFVARHRFAFATAAVAGLLLAGWLALDMPRAAVPAAAGLVALVGAYMAMRHVPRLRRRTPASLTALTVGALIAGAAALFPLAHAGGGPPVRLVAEVLALALVCAANVALIGRWERSLADGADAPAPRHGLGTGLAGVGLALAAIAGLVQAVAGGPTAVPLAVAVAAAALIGIDRVPGIDPSVRHVWADAVLLAPWFGPAWPAWSGLVGLAVLSGVGP